MIVNASGSTTFDTDESTASPPESFSSTCSREDVQAARLPSLVDAKAIQSSISKSGLATLIALMAATCLTAVPWLTDNAIARVSCGWAGITLALALSTQAGLASRLLVIWCWCSISVGMAFHWSPAAMAYTLSSGIFLGLLVTIPLVLWDGLRMALGLWIAARITKDIRFHWLAAAACFITLEYLMIGVFPWKIGYIQLSMPWTIQAVDIFGPSYPTLVLFAVAGAIQLIVFRFLEMSSIWSEDINERAIWIPKAMSQASWKSVLVSPAFIFLAMNLLYSAFAFSFWQSECDRSPSIRVGLVQVDPSYVESLAKSQALTASIADKVDLVCWPESSGGNYEIQLDDLSDADKVFQCSRNPSRGMRPWPNPTCEILFAGKNYRGDPEKPDELFVTAMLVDRHEQITERYNKRYLMPFGEYVPFRDYVPGLAALFDMDDEISPGTASCAFDSATGARIGALVCYEDMVPNAARQAIAARANLLVALINGSAFESPFTLFQHRMLAQLRALENRRYFLRCAATGETCVINPFGQIESRLPMQTSAVLVSDVGLLESRTFYSQFPWLFPMFGGALAGSALWRWSRRKV